MKRILLLFNLLAFLLAGCTNEGNGKKEKMSPEDSLAESYLSAAVKTARWLTAGGIHTPAGIEWRANPADSGSVYYSLYYGSPGIVLFYMELFRVTEDSSYLHMAEKGSDNLLAVIANPSSIFFTGHRTGFTGPEDRRMGLYSGLAGIGFVMEEMYSVSGGKKYRGGMLECVRILKDSARVNKNEASWSATEDLLCGDAGTGLFLLYAFEKTKDSSLLELASKTGYSLVRKAVKDPSGLKWPMVPGFPRLMPNFAHGTSGVCYFLFKLYKATGNKEFFLAAGQGALYLKQHAEKNNGLVFHHEGDGIYKGKCGGPACISLDSCIGSKLYYLSWCHGPAGTGRLFYLMGKETGDSSWHRLSAMAADAVMKSGMPEQLTHGFWNNLGQCCGSAGAGDYFLEMHELTGNTSYKDFTEYLANFILKKAVEEGGGLKFPHAENNRERKVVYPQTGYMTGAAGIGMFFLHLYESEKGMTTLVHFPDSPY